VRPTTWSTSPYAPSRERLKWAKNDRLLRASASMADAHRPQPCSRLSSASPLPTGLRGVTQRSRELGLINSKVPVTPCAMSLFALIRTKHLLSLVEIQRLQCCGFWRTCSARVASGDEASYARASFGHKSVSGAHQPWRLLRWLHARRGGVHRQRMQCSNLCSQSVRRALTKISEPRI